MSSAKQPDGGGGHQLNPFDDFDDDEDIELSDSAGEGSTDKGEDGSSFQTVSDSYVIDEGAQTIELKGNCLAIEDLIRTKALNPFVLEELGENLTNMQKILSKDKPESQGQVGPCLKYLLHENVIENVYMFSTRQREYAKDVRIFLLKFFTEVFARSLQPILIHQQILRPVSKLLRACEGTQDPELANHLVPLLHQMCILMQENQSLLDLFFIESKVHMQSRFLVLTALIPHMHEVSDVGNRARDALLLCLSLADQLSGTHLSRFIATDCNFCQVLATGLSGLYSELPTSRPISLDDWQSPVHVIQEAVPQLIRFTQALGFCNSVLQMAPKVVCDTVLSLVREGFLNQVMGAALLQSSEEAVMFSTTYLTIFLNHISDVALMREFLRFITLSKFDGRPILNSLMQNIGSANHKLCAVTLELFYVLLSLNCEDVVLELVLRYLIPGNHVMPNQLAIIGSTDLYSQAARRFLQLIPTACHNAEKLFLETIHRPTTPPQSLPEESAPHPPIFTSSPLHTHHTLERPTPVRAPTVQPTPMKPLSNAFGSSNPFDLPVLSQRGTRSRSGSDASTSSLVSISSSSSAHQTGNTSLTASTTGRTMVPLTGADEEQKSIGVGKYSSMSKATGPSFHFEYISPEMAYFKNLIASRKVIQECASRCKCWSSSYEKCVVSKDSVMEGICDIPTKSLEMEDVPVRVRITSEEGETDNRNEEDNFDFGRFRSRATTVSAHSRISRTTSVKVHDRLQSRRAIVAAEKKEESLTTEHAQSQNGTNDLLNLRNSHQALRRTATVKDRTSPRTSPRFSRKLAGTKFEDKVGLFLKIVLEKLSDMLQLPPAVNVLLTRLISRLAHYPQPLLRSVLLNHHLVLRPGIPNLIYVLQTVKTTVDSYARTQDGFEKRLGRARKTMIYRARVRNSQIEPSAAQQMVTRLLRQSSRIDMGLELPPPPEAGPSLLRKRISKTNIMVPELSESQADELAPVSRSRVRTEGSSLKSSVRVKKKKVTTDTLFAIIIFDEFLRELAALSQEHSVLNPLTYSAKHEDE